MIRALLNAHEAVQALRRAEHAINPLVTLRRDAGIVGMASRADLVLVRDRDHAIQEVGDAFPSGVGIDRASTCPRRIGRGLG